MDLDGNGYSWSDECIRALRLSSKPVNTRKICGKNPGGLTGKGIQEFSQFSTGATIFESEKPTIDFPMDFELMYRKYPENR